MINDGSAHVRQSTDYSCGRAAAAIVLRILGDKKRERDMGDLPADPEDGCPPQALAKFFRNRKFRTKSKFAKPELRSLEAMIDKGWPVIVAYQDWASKPSETNYHKSWDNGHYSVLVGYDDERFWFLDPSSDRKKRSLDKKDFAGRWRDITTKGKIFHRWGLAVGPKKPKAPKA